MTKKAARPCGVCAHAARHQIDLGLVHRVPARVLGIRFNLSKDALLRHARNHLSPVQRAALLSAVKPTEIDLEKLRTSESENLLAQLVAQRARLQQQSEAAAEMGDTRGAIAAESAILSNLVVVGKLLGQLVQHHSVTHSSLLISPDYLRLRSVLVDALRPYPDAARTVSAALHRLESDAARDISAAAATQKAKPVPAVIDHAPTFILGPPPC